MFILRKYTAPTLAWLVLAVASATSNAQDCPPSWDPSFGLPGLNSTVNAFETLLGPDGPALIVTGRFTVADDHAVGKIAQWSEGEWNPLGMGIGGVAAAGLALSTFDDGTGENQLLFVGGEFTRAGGDVAGNLAAWNGSTWSTPAGFVNDTVFALATWGVGNDAALFAGGLFTVVDQTAVNHIAQWDGVSWSPLGQGVNATVSAMTVFDDGNGEALFVGGAFTSADGEPALHVAKWDGLDWSPLGAGLNGVVRALAVSNDVSEPALFVGGEFTSAGGEPAFRVARWDGTNWSALGTGMNATVRALAVFDDGTGETLYAGGSFTTAGASLARGLARWNGATWDTVGSGVDNAVFALLGTDSISPLGVSLFAGGTFTQGDDLPANFVARWKTCFGDSGDFDMNGTTDLWDFAQSVECLTGPDGFLAENCEHADFNTDGDGDLRDLAAFFRAFNP